jgi:hypothetical protein
MLFLTEDAKLVCLHEMGRVQNVPTQNWVTIAQRRLLVEIDPEGKSIKGCPMLPPANRPCLITLKVDTGYSEFLRIDGRRICLDTVIGSTDGFPPSKYKVNDAGQQFVGGAR